MQIPGDIGGARGGARHVQVTADCKEAVFRDKLASGGVALGAGGQFFGPNGMTAEARVKDRETCPSSVCLGQLTEVFIGANGVLCHRDSSGFPFLLSVSCPSPLTEPEGFSWASLKCLHPPSAAAACHGQTQACSVPSIPKLPRTTGACSW